MGICFSEASRCSDVSSLPKNNKSLRCILYLKNFFIDDNFLVDDKLLLDNKLLVDDKAGMDAGFRRHDESRGDDSALSM